MNCPKCSIPLNITERHGVEIDYCPQCRGIWLDRGELDKVIDRAISAETPAGVPRIPPPPPAEWGRRHPDDDDDLEFRRKRRKKSFLGELFDFD
ncbi:MAG: zf-TFIIB domain-containing protein [Armatimonadetes bacterium]|nr:zf-TFIIB domain-containing protein [Armatimonadota bacterium]